MVDMLLVACFCFMCKLKRYQVISDMAHKHTIYTLAQHVIRIDVQTKTRNSRNILAASHL